MVIENYDSINLPNTLWVTAVGFCADTIYTPPDILYWIKLVYVIEFQTKNK